MRVVSPSIVQTTINFSSILSSNVLLSWRARRECWEAHAHPQRCPGSSRSSAQLASLSGLGSLGFQRRVLRLRRKLHRTEIFALGVAAVRHVAVVGHGRILLRAGRHGYWSTSCNVTPPPSAFPCALSFPCAHAAARLGPAHITPHLLLNGPCPTQRVRST